VINNPRNVVDKAASNGRILREAKPHVRIHQGSFFLEGVGLFVARFWEVQMLPSVLALDFHVDVLPAFAHQYIGDEIRPS
jgi:hypothetical protein